MQRGKLGVWSALFAAAALIVCCFSNPALAQREQVSAIYEAASTRETNIAGVHTFEAPPYGFNALSAGDEELAVYGFPPRPSPQADPAGFAHWAKAMTASRTRWSGELKPTSFYSRPARMVPAPAGTPITAAPKTGASLNWSGFINTNTLKKYNTKTSFYYVLSEFNVPVVNQPANTCDGGWDLESSWNGIDGFQDQGALLQGGSLSGAYCRGNTRSWLYYAWVEWFPAYAALEEFTVNPGDDLFVETWDTSATQGYVYLADLTTGIYGTYGLTPNGGAGLIGNSAEYVVERPCCQGTNFYPLANYVLDFWAGSYAVNFNQYNNGTAPTFYPGSTAATNYLIDMIDDKDTQVISAPTAQGKYGILFDASGCATSGGCTP